MIYTTQSGWGYNGQRFRWELHDERGAIYGWITAEVFANATWWLMETIYDRFGSFPVPPFAPLLADAA